MLKIMRSNRLKRFIAVLFILLSVFSMCFSVAAKAEVAALSFVTIAVCATLLTSFGIKFANSGDLVRGVQYFWDSLLDGARASISGLVSLCGTYQKAKLQIPFALYQQLSALANELFKSDTVEGGQKTLDPIVLSGASVGFTHSGMIFPSSLLGKVTVDWLGGGNYTVRDGTQSVVTTFGSYQYSVSLSKPSGAAVSGDTLYPKYSFTVNFNDGASFSSTFWVGSLNWQSFSTDGYLFNIPFSAAAGSYSYNIVGPAVIKPTSVDGIGYFAPPSVGLISQFFVENVYCPGWTSSDTFTVLKSATESDGTAIPCGSGGSSMNVAAWAYTHYAASLQKNEDVLNYGVSRNPALTTNPDCTVPQTVDGSKDVFMDIPGLKGDTALEDILAANPADVATPADTKVENPTLVEGADTNVGEGDVTVPADASWLDKILAWLKALLDGILSIPGVISKGIAGVLEGIKAIPAAFAKWFESIIEGIKAIGLSFTDWLSKLIEGFKSLLLSLFEPTVSLDEAFAALKAKALAKFPTDGLIDSISAFRDYLSGLGDTPPSFTFVYMGNTCTIAPFDWLSGYRRYWIAFASFFMWFGFIRRTIKRMPQLLGGIT